MTRLFGAVARIILAAISAHSYAKPQGSRFLPAIMCICLISAGNAYAQTAVSGVIPSDTRWTASASPYLVTGELRIDGGAILAVEPGTRIYMEAGASVRVVHGAIHVDGTAAKPVIISSAKVHRGQPAARGDYAAWTLTPGTAATTRFNHVRFEYGSGLIIHGTSPALNHVDLRHHSGPAISIDLAASPTGQGNSASDNDLNGIAVPAGDIASEVTWTLRGIPYVVASGTVSVGASPKIISISPSTLYQGEAATVNVTGQRLDDVARVFSANAGVTATVLPGSDETTVRLQVTTAGDAALGATDLDLLVSAGHARRSDAFVVQPPQPVLESADPATIYVGQPTPRLTLSGRNFRPDSKVLLDGVELSHVTPSSTEVEFDVPTQVQTGDLALRMRTPIIAGGTEYFESNELQVAVAQSYVSAPTMNMNPVQGQSSTFSLDIPYAAPAGGIEFSISSVPSDLAQVSPTVVVPAGQRSVDVTLLPLRAGAGHLLVAATNFPHAELPFQAVQAPALSILNSNSVILAGTTANVLVRASRIAGSGGLVVALSSSAPSIVGIPASVTIPEGQTQIEVQLNAGIVGTASIDAQAAGFDSGTLDIEVHAAALTLPSDVWIEKGAARQLQVTIAAPAPVGGVTITLSSDTPDALSMPATVTVPEGATSVSFIAVLSPAAENYVLLSASASGYATASTSIRALNGIALNWDNDQSGPALYVAAGETLDYNFTLANSTWPQPLTVSLASGNAAIASVNANVTLQQSVNNGVGTITINAGSPGETTLVISADGMVDKTVPVVVLQDPELRFERTQQIVGVGMLTNQNANSVRYYVGGQPYAGAYPLPALRFVTDDARVSVTGIQSGAVRRLRLTGPSVEIAGAVTVDAVSKGFRSPLQKLAVTVAKPELAFEGLSMERLVGDSADWPAVALHVPGDDTGYPQVLSTSKTIQLSVFHAGEDTGTRLANGNITIGAGYYRASLTLGTPSAAGTYTLTATAPLATPITSPDVVVSSSTFQLKLSDFESGQENTSILVGAGMRRLVYITRVRNGSSDYASTPLTVNLQCVPADACSLSQSSVTIPTGSAAASFSVSNVPQGMTEGVLQMSASGYPTRSIAISHASIRPLLDGIQTTRGLGSANDGFAIRLVGSNGEELTNHEPINPIRVDLSIVDASPAGVVPGFVGYPTGLANGGAIVPLEHFMMNETSTTYHDWSEEASVHVAPPVASGTYRVRASLVGGPDTVSEPVTVQGAVTLAFDRTEARVGRGFVGRAYVSRTFEGAPTQAGELDLQVSCTPVAVCSVPATVTIPNGDDRAVIEITALGLTGGTPALLHVTAAGAQPIELPLTVVDPVLTADIPKQTFDLAIPEINHFPLRLTFDGDNGMDAAVSTGFRVRYEITDADPVDVVPGLLDSGNDVVSFVELPLGANTTVRVAQPTKLGRYRVRAQIVATPAVNGAPLVIEPLTTDEFVVVADSYTIQTQSEVVVGRGMTKGVFISHARGGAPWYDSVPRTVHLTCSPASRCSVPESVVIEPDMERTYVQVTGLDLTNGSPAVLSASPAGYSGDRSVSASITVEQPVFAVEGLSSTRYIGEEPDRFFLQAQGADGGDLGYFETSPLISWQLVDAVPADIVGVYAIDQDGSETPVTSLQFGQEYGVGTPSAPGTYRLSLSGDVVGQYVSGPVSVLAGGPVALTMPDDIEMKRVNDQVLETNFLVERLVDGRKYRPDVPVTLNLSCVPALICIVPATVTIPAGSTGVSVQLETSVDFPVGQDATLTITADGYPTTGATVKFRAYEF